MKKARFSQKHKNTNGGIRQVRIVKSYIQCESWQDRMTPRQRTTNQKTISRRDERNRKILIWESSKKGNFKGSVIQDL